MTDIHGRLLADRYDAFGVFQGCLAFAVDVEGL